ncbi:glycosyltransferase family 4 protein [Microbacterium elymi]|uniref:Glycosyltransferase family 4 protein n=1 Tax=Microbacterium elymi TaxID=2909587 RepID=A0ABY5NH41_9MICO|nr:glycosyltransferase family 4 protein [Microbacterium elymi]UUT34482.1 glycosyltransferase family 4 protein [Microbacterium elymi]
MRILVHLNSLELGGTQINAVDFAHELRARGYESVLVGDRRSAGPGPSLYDYACTRDVRIEAYEPEPGMAAHARQLKRMAEALGVDLIHVYGMWGAARPTYWGPSRFGRLPWVQTVYEMSVTPVVHRHMPLVVGTGYLVDELAARPGRTILVSPPVDLTADSPEGAEGDGFRTTHELGDGVLMGIVSRLDSRMKAVSIGVAIEAMRDLASTGATLFVVGGGDAESALRAQAGAVNEAVGRQVVRLLGPSSDPRPAYSAADIMLGMGGSAARALAFGKPLIVQGEAGWSELFEPGTANALARSSYWSPDRPADPVGDLVRIAAPLIVDDSQRRELGRFGREFAVERFGLDAMSDRMAEFYAAAVGSYRRREWILDLPREGRRLLEKIGRLLRGGLRGPGAGGDLG